MTILRVSERNEAYSYYIPKARSNRDKYIQKDFVLVLGDVKIRISKKDTLHDVVRKVNLKSHVTGIKAKAVKGQLCLEPIRRWRNSPNGILLKQQPSGEGIALDANQIIANYLNSLKPKNTVANTEIAVNNEVNAWCDLMHLCSLNEEAPPAPVEQEEQLGQIDEANESDEESVDLDEESVDLNVADLFVEEFPEPNYIAIEDEIDSQELLDIVGQINPEELVNMSLDQINQFVQNVISEQSQLQQSPSVNNNDYENLMNEINAVSDDSFVTVSNGTQVNVAPATNAASSVVNGFDLGASIGSNNDSNINNVNPYQPYGFNINSFINLGSIEEAPNEGLVRERDQVFNEIENELNISL